jgi:hypothetical protein
MDINSNFLLVAMKKCLSLNVMLVNRLDFADHIVGFANISIASDAEYRLAQRKDVLLDIHLPIKE